MDGIGPTESNGKRHGPHVEKRLNAAFVRSAPPGRHTDGGGLYLEVDASGARRWMVRLMVRGKRRDFGLGSAKLVSLAEARTKADEWRKIARSGGDPKLPQRRQEGREITFEELARQVHKQRIENKRSNGKHVAQWIRTLETYAFPTMGRLSVAEILLDDIEAVLEPIWHTKGETADRVLQRITAVLEVACARGYRTTGNPGKAARTVMRSQDREVKSFEAIPYEELPDLVKVLIKSEAIGAYALLFTTFTAMRSGTIRQARWDQFENGFTEWRIPKKILKGGWRLKGDDPFFRVPISIPARELILRLREKTPNSQPLVFPSPTKPEKPICENTMRKLLQTHYPTATVHGMRAAFRTWATKIADCDEKIAEISLAHIVGSETENAYNRAEYYDPREILLEKWGLWMMDRWEVLANGVDQEAYIRAMWMGEV
ncbi:integrase arm-type DNA-binding domain-containing protein [Thioclava sp. GXIMD4216]|uniref:tyrosine-type recombinase/integrase n=1 Tax=Thioclava sp. GXIMD4216 TaxID=3131929 RepID=UPI0030D15CE7